MVHDHEHAVRQRAYDLWVEEGQPEGRHEEHWRQAEKDLGIGNDKAVDGGTGAQRTPGTPPPGLENTLA